MQTFGIIQPITIESDGRQDMCDACPDVTAYDGKLVWSCRLEELRRFGQFVETIPQSRLAEGSVPETEKTTARAPIKVGT